jgi:hypothetical protein
LTADVFFGLASAILPWVCDSLAWSSTLIARLFALGDGFTLLGDAGFFDAAILVAAALMVDLLVDETELDFFDAETSLLDNEYLDVGDMETNQFLVKRPCFCDAMISLCGA